MYLWHVVRAGDGRVELVDGWESLDAVIAEMALSSWEEPDNRWVSYVTDDSSREAVAVVIFGPGTEFLVAVSDGRLLRFPVPPRYRDDAIGGDSPDSNPDVSELEE
jgi:hypothetical protein